LFDPKDRKIPGLASGAQGCLGLLSGFRFFQEQHVATRAHGLNSSVL
jgi:hypothetical protein